MMDEREKTLEKIRELGDKVTQGKDYTTTIDVDFTSVSGKNYKGRIVLRRPAMIDYMKMGAIKASLLKIPVDYDENQRPIYPDMDFIDESVKFLSHIISVFKVLTVKCPEWFLYPEKIEDFDVLNHVFERYEKWLGNFRISSGDKFERDSEVTTPEEIMVDS